MPDIVLQLENANIPRLDEELRAALGDAITGVSYHRGALRVHFLRPPTPVQRDLAEGVIAAHDPSQPADAQRRAAEAWAALEKLSLEGDALSEPEERAALRQAVRWLLTQQFG